MVNHQRASQEHHDTAERPRAWSADQDAPRRDSGRLADEPPSTADTPYELLIVTDTLDEFLERIAKLAVQRLGEDLSCEITARTGHQLSGALKGACVDPSDTTQYTARFGPAGHVHDAGEVVQVDDVSNDDRCTTRCTDAYGYGSRSSLTMPISTGARIVGALNLYSCEPHRFGAEQRRRAAEFADQAAGALTLAARINGYRRRCEHLQQALASRAVIDQAIGVLMAQKRCNPREAFGVLCAASQNRNVKLRDLAADIVGSFHPRPQDPSGPLPRLMADASSIDPPDRRSHGRRSTARTTAT